MDRLVRRTRVKRSSYTVLGAALTPALVVSAAGGAGDESDGGREERGSEAGAGKRSLKEEVDEEAFDDTGGVLSLRVSLALLACRCCSVELRGCLHARAHACASMRFANSTRFTVYRLPLTVDRLGLGSGIQGLGSLRFANSTW
jgi:hypothetical protein